MYYQIEYKRYFVSSKDGTEYLTVWTSSNNECYLIPERYYSPFVPKENYIKTVNHRNYIGIVWDTKDPTKYKISIYNNYEVYNLDSSVKVYDGNDYLLKEYKISVTPESGETLSSDSLDQIKKHINYEYIDLNRIYGIKRFIW